MIEAYLTIDTELTPGLHAMGMSPQENLELSVFGRTPNGEYGINYQMDVFDRYGLKAVFFVESLCAYACGDDVLRRVVASILGRGHQVQLHLHTEWLPYMREDPINGRRGMNMSEFSESDQAVMLEMGVDALVRCGASHPLAFRAGNFGADRNTLRAVHATQIKFDSSYNACLLGKTCQIDATGVTLDPVELEGIVEFPLSVFHDRPGHLRPAQIAAASRRELRWVMDTANANHWRTLTFLSHGFELISRKRRAASRLLLHRFEGFCADLWQRRTWLTSAVYREDSMSGLRPLHPASSVPESSVWRTAGRIAEQAINRLLYE